jgi:hypothetical protein
MLVGGWGRQGRTLDGLCRQGFGSELASDRFWNSKMDEMISADNEDPCMGTELNICERAKVGIRFKKKLMSIKLIILIISVILCILIYFFWCLIHMYCVATTSQSAHIGGRWRPA